MIHRTIRSCVAYSAMDHASEALVLDDVVKHPDRVRLFDVIARFLSLWCEHTLYTKNPRKTKI